MFQKVHFYCLFISNHPLTLHFKVLITYSSHLSHKKNFFLFQRFGSNLFVLVYILILFSENHRSSCFFIWKMWIFKCRRESFRPERHGFSTTEFSIVGHSTLIFKDDMVKLKIWPFLQSIYHRDLGILKKLA